MNNSFVGLTSKRKSLIVLVIAQIVFLLGITFTHYATSWYGQEITLKTVPIDPRDMLYGDYAILQYEISTLPVSKWMDPPPSSQQAVPERGDVIYVVLTPNAEQNELYDAQEFYSHKPSLQDNEILLKAKVDDMWDDTSVRVIYGIEKYYIPENTGKELEEQARQGSYIAHVKVSSWSGPVLESLHLKEQ